MRWLPEDAGTAHALVGGGAWCVMHAAGTISGDTMSNDDVGNDYAAGTDAVGIVVHNGGGAGGASPRTVAFVWGGKVRPAPSLPYGRWKRGVRTAA